MSADTRTFEPDLSSINEMIMSAWEGGAKGSPGKSTPTGKIKKKDKGTREQLEACALRLMDLNGALINLEKKYDATQEGGDVTEMDTTGRGKAAFLTRIADTATETAQRIVDEAPAVLDDVDLVALYVSYSIEKHPITRYQKWVNDLVSRYDKNRVGQLGSARTRHDGSVNNFVFQTAHVAAFGQKRLAIVEQEVAITDDAVDDIHKEHNAHRVGKPTFVRFVDDDFADVATARSKAGTRETFESFDKSEIWTTDWTYDVTLGYTELESGGSLALEVWRKECERALDPAQPTAGDAVVAQAAAREGTLQPQ